MSTENIQDIYPLSPMQQGMLFHSVYTPEKGVYVEHISCAIHGKVNVAAFEQAWQQAVDRNPILRTAFVWEGVDEPVQVVHKQVGLPIERLDWRKVASEQQVIQRNQFFKSHLDQGFDLSEAPLMRLALIQEADDRYRFSWTHHHLLVDGWSMPLLLNEVFSIYESLNNGKAFQREPSRPYRDYIAWLQQQDQAKAEQFWRSYLKDFTAPTPITVDRFQPGGQDDYGTERLLLSQQSSNALNDLSRQHQLTLSTLMQGAWALLLSHYSGEDDVVFGATVSGRPTDLPGAESMLGLFINTLPVRAKIAPDKSLLSWLKEFQTQLTELRQFEYSSLVQIQGWSEVPRDLPLFNSILVFENYPVSESMSEKEGSFKISDFEFFSRTNYPLTVVASPGKQIGLEIAYEKKRYDAETINRILRHLEKALESFFAEPDQHLSKMSFLTESERHQILVEWNQTSTDYPHDKCAHELFEAQVAQTPDAIALIFEDQEITYQQLNDRVNQLAHYLRKQGVKPEYLVGICAERSIEMIEGILAILKAGGAYVPMDPNYPKERLAYILEDSAATILLTTKKLTGIFADTTAKIICLDADWETIAQESNDNLDNEANPENLAYVIYTSGSTGKPKGTLLSHRGLCNFVRVFSGNLHIGANSRMLQFASIGFDASVAEIFPPLLSGASVILARQETLLSVADLYELIQQKEITVATLPPSLLAVLSPDGLPDFKDVMSVGEACTVDIVRRWSNGRNFWNGYGPTEVTIGASWNIVNDLPDDARSVPIGKAIGNKQIYLLDKYL
ncbi:condensation domain-containing protein, partial [candidate division KSB1 bacterium]|nr:condensation domain-containing protein [candidate division KSB1 bacterium]